MEELVIYHNPRCSKSRATLELITERGIEPRIVRYLEEPPTPDELRALLRRLGLRPRALMRKGERVYKELSLDDDGLDDDALVQAMTENPVLIERPIVVRGERAVLGRPPENVLELL